MKSSVQRWIVTASLFAAHQLCAAQVGQDGPEIAKLIGQPCPKFSMPTTENTFFTHKNLLGKVSIILFWNSRLEPLAAMPELHKLVEGYEDKLQVIAANSGEKGRRSIKEAAISFASETKYRFTYTYNNDEFQEAIGCRWWPSMLIIDKEGIVRRIIMGDRIDQIKQALQLLIGPLPVDGQAPLQATR